MTYKFLTTSHFSDNLEKIRRSDRTIAERIEKTIKEKLGFDPKHNTKPLTGEFKGKRVIYVGNKGHRIVFTICKECKDFGHKGRFNNCPDCSDEDDVIKLWDVDSRGSIYK